MSDTITKIDIVETVHKKNGFSKKESAEIVEAIFETVKRSLERGQSVKISGFGKFDVRSKRARVGRNPQTGGQIEISARRVLSFRPSPILRNVLTSKMFEGAPRE